MFEWGSWGATSLLSSHSDDAVPWYSGATCWFGLQEAVEVPHLSRLASSKCAQSRTASSKYAKCRWYIDWSSSDNASLTNFIIYMCKITNCIIRTCEISVTSIYWSSWYATYMWEHEPVTNSHHHELHHLNLRNLSNIHRSIREASEIPHIVNTWTSHELTPSRPASSKCAKCQWHPDWSNWDAAYYKHRKVSRTPKSRLASSKCAKE